MERKKVINKGIIMYGPSWLWLDSLLLLGLLAAVCVILVGLHLAVKNFVKKSVLRRVDVGLKVTFGLVIFLGLIALVGADAFNSPTLDPFHLFSP